MLTSLRTGARPMAAARVMLGIAAGLTSLEAVGLLYRLQDDRILVPPVSWAPTADALPADLLLSVGLVAALALTLGLAAPLAAMAIAGVESLLLLSDAQFFSNHRLLLVLLCLAIVFARSDHAWAPGAARRRARHATVPWWPQLLMVAAVSSCYLFAGLSKINPVFLEGVEIDTLNIVTIPPSLLTSAAVGVIATEVAIGVGLWWPRLRLLAVTLGTTLHVSIVVLLSAPLVFLAFALMCWAVYPLALTRPPLTSAARRHAPD